MCESAGMRTGIAFEVSVADRARLEAVVADRNSPHKHAWRGVNLATADGRGRWRSHAGTGKSKPCVWRWQERFMAEGVDGLMRDKTRPSRIPPLEPDVALRIVRLTLAGHPPRRPTGRPPWMAGKVRRFRLFCATHLARMGSSLIGYGRSSSPKTPNFIDKLRDIVGLYVNPPAHTIGLNVDEKSQIEALDRAQPGLPLKKGPRRDHDPRLQVSFLSVECPQRRRVHDVVQRGRLGTHGRAWSAALACWRNDRVEALACAPGIPRLDEQEKRDRLPKGSYQALVARGGLRIAEGLRVSPPSELWRVVLDAWGAPETVICDRFRIGELQDCVNGTPLRPRVSPLEQSALRYPVATQAWGRRAIDGRGDFPAAAGRVLGRGGGQESRSEQRKAFQEGCEQHGPR